MNKVYQMWYLLFIYYDFATVVNPFFRAVKGALQKMLRRNRQLIRFLKRIIVMYKPS